MSIIKSSLPQGSGTTTIGTRVREIREARDWSVQQLANAADLTFQELNNLEDGTWRYIDHATLGKLGRALECGVGVLLVHPKSEQR